MSKVQGFKGLVCKPDRNKVCARDGVKGVSINSPPLSMKQHLLVMFGQVTTPPETQGQHPSLRPTHSWGQTQASLVVKPQPSRHPVPLSLQNTDIHSTIL